MNNNFAITLNKFLSSYLPSLRNLSANTISSYCDTFRILLGYMRDEKQVNIEKIEFSDFTDDLIIEFVDWLKKTRKNKVSTCNQRLAAIHSFFRYTQVEVPSSILISQQILNIPSSKSSKPIIKYLTVSDTKLLLSLPNPTTKNGRRDMVILSLMYDTGARVSEILDLKARDIRTQHPARVVLTGKGNKSREIPLLDGTVKLLDNFLYENNLTDNKTLTNRVFTNKKGERFTRNGVDYILKKYAEQARVHSSTLPDKITPHVLRHSKAMHLLQAGVSIVYIKDILGHVDIKTTQVYASADLNMKRKALETVEIITPHRVASWQDDKDLLSWLKDYGKN